MKKVIVLFAFCASLFSQVTSIPAAAGGGGGGATAISGLSDLKVTRNSSTELAVAAGNARQGATTTLYSAATATLSGTTATSTAYIYITSGGTLTVGHNGAATVTCSGCTTATGISAFPADAIPLATATYTSTAWDVSGITDLRAIPSRENLEAGDGISLGFTATGVTASTDSATVPRYSTGSGAPAASCTQGRDFYLDTAASTLYQCTATNTWGAVGGDALPTQTSNAGKALETNGTSASWQPGVSVYKTILTGDVCGASPTTVYDFGANELAVGDFVEIEAVYAKTGAVSAPSAIITIEGTSVSGSNAIGTGDTHAFNRVIARITSTSATRVIGLRQRANGSVGSTYTAALTVDTTSATGFTVGAQATSCSGGDTVDAAISIKVVRVASR